MVRQWVSKWIDRLAAVSASRATPAAWGAPWDYDADREFRDLDAIRVRFPDHA